MVLLNSWDSFWMLTSLGNLTSKLFCPKPLSDYSLLFKVIKPWVRTPSPATTFLCHSNTANSRICCSLAVLGTGTWSVLKYSFRVLVLVFVLACQVVLVLVLACWVFDTRLEYAAPVWPHLLNAKPIRLKLQLFRKELSTSFISALTACLIPTFCSSLTSRASQNAENNWLASFLTLWKNRDRVYITYSLLPAILHFSHA